MPLIDLKTDLKSIKYGKDVFGGGNSLQPFIRTSIPEDYQGKNNTIDFAGRQGGNIPGGLITYGTNEFIRIGKFLRTPQGLQFIAKQEILSKQEARRSSDLVKSKPSYSYNPINTLLAAAGGELGLHPYGKGGNISINDEDKYYKVYPKAPVENNVLIKILTTKQDKKDTNPNGNIISYEGGPGQLLFGKTNIRFSDQRTGKNNNLAISQPSYFYSGSALHETNVTPDGNSINYNNLLGASKKANLDKPQDTGFTEEGQQIKVYGPESDNSTLSKNEGDYKIVSGSQYNQGKPEHAVESPNYNKNLGASTEWNKTSPGVNNILVSPDQTGISEDGVSNLLFGVSAKNTTLSLNQGALNIVEGFGYDSKPSNKNVGLRYSINPDTDDRAGRYEWTSRLKGASQTYLNQTLAKGGNVNLGDIITPYNNVYTPKQEGTFPSNSSVINFYKAWNNDPNSNQSTVWNQLSLINDPTVYQDKGIYSLTDFREIVIRGSNGRFATAPNQTVIAKAPNYATNNIETRLSLGDPGRRNNRNVYSYSTGILSNKPLDTINSKKVFKSTTNSASQELKEDAVKFAISAINNDNPFTSDSLQFRAFIDTFSDTYASKWDGVNYLGRGDTFYNYNGFERSISLSFTIAAQSRAELIPIYEKLNILASFMLPDYSNQGLMQGNILTLTVGDYVVDQAGVCDGFSLDLMEGTWEIALDDDGNKIYNSEKVKELPHIIKVSGFKFKPIQNFVAKKINYPEKVDKTNSLFAFQKTPKGNNLIL
tara:strand:- start:4971 stop:7268 length:2298 start_codon:yes stop_codon:yes gene_type:complete